MKKVHIVTVQFAVDEEHDIDERHDDLIGELKSMCEDSEVGLRFKRFSVDGPTDEKEWFQLGLF